MTSICSLSAPNFNPLRKRSGARLLALSIVATVVLAAYTLSAATIAEYTVTNSGSSRDEVGTLNWAVFTANYYGADVNYIRFNIPDVAEQAVITLSEELFIARLMVIDGKSQPGYKETPKICIDANGLNGAFLLVGNVANIPPTSSGGVSTSSGSTIQGFQIVNYKSNGITIFKESQGNWIQENWIGFKRESGSKKYWHNAKVHPYSRGIGLQSSFNTIRQNTISGVDNAITIGEAIEDTWSGDYYLTNAIERNFIGTDPTGSHKIGNASDGIFLGAGAKENFLGPGNVISGNASSGVELLHHTNYGNIIIGSIIGLNAEGTAAIPNDELGVLIAGGATFNDVGGPSGGNIIAGNTLGGVCIGMGIFPGPDGTNGNYVEFNLIGTDGTGKKIIPGQGTAVTVGTNSRGNVVRGNVLVGSTYHGVTIDHAKGNGIYDNWIGATADGTALTNGGYGVYLQDAPNNFIMGNTFGGNSLGNMGFYGNSSDNAISNNGG